MTPKYMRLKSTHMTVGGPDKSPLRKFANRLHNPDVTQSVVNSLKSISPLKLKKQLSQMCTTYNELNLGSSGPREL